MENEIALAKEEYAALKEFARPVRSPRRLYGAHRPYEAQKKDGAVRI